MLWVPTAEQVLANQRTRRDLIFVEEASMAAGLYLRTSSLSFFVSSSTIHSTSPRVPLPHIID
jgi:hypothetical protein